MGGLSRTAVALPSHRQLGHSSVKAAAPCILLPPTSLGLVGP